MRRRAAKVRLVRATMARRSVDVRAGYDADAPALMMIDNTRVRALLDDAARLMSARVRDDNSGAARRGRRDRHA